MSTTNLKELKCSTCPTVLEVDRTALVCQCSACIQASRPKARSDEPEAEQLELGEAAS